MIFNGNFSKSFFLRLIQLLIKCKDEKEFLQKEETHTLLQLLYLLNKNNLSIPIQFIIFYYNA
jgi:hypothetical protein